MFDRKTQFVCPNCQHIYQPVDWTGWFEFCPKCGYGPSPDELQAQVIRARHWVIGLSVVIVVTLIAAAIAIVLEL